MIPVTSFAGKKVALFGLGGSGLASAQALVAGGAEVIAFDDSAASLDNARAILASSAFVGAARELDIDGMERIVDDAFAAQRFELAMDDVVFPALRAVGRAWAAGDLDVGAEHAASETVRRRLSRFFDAARTPMTAILVLVGMPPGGRHELGAFAFAVASRRAGQAVTYLGMDVPLESWLRSARETGAVAIVLGAVTNEDVAGVDAVVEAIRTLSRPLTCFAGGPASLEATVVSGAVRLPSNLDEAVSAVMAATAPAEPRTNDR